ncbi:MAG: aquaporin [Oxalobacteraceae bacterium]|nr:MAG: aquaporin [Oxalobacteraceae bacterium]
MDTKKHAAELLGTFALVLMGTGAIIVNQETGGAIGHAGISLVFGLVVLAMIQTFGDVSGAHLNPAVSLAMAAAGRFPWRAVPGYAAAQAAGAFAASGLLRALFPANAGLGATLPAGSPGQSFILETVLTGLLMLTILSVTTGAKEKGPTVAATVGAVIALEAMFAGPVSGASMNPVRSLAPAVVGGHLTHLWIYLTAPILGALVALQGELAPYSISDLSNRVSRAADWGWSCFEDSGFPRSQ